MGDFEYGRIKIEDSLENIRDILIRSVRSLGRSINRLRIPLFMTLLFAIANIEQN